MGYYLGLLLEVRMRINLLSILKRIYGCLKIPNLLVFKRNTANINQ